jgi:hypothetical protein
MNSRLLLAAIVLIGLLCFPLTAGRNRRASSLPVTVGGASTGAAVLDDGWLSTGSDMVDGLARHFPRRVDVAWDDATAGDPDVDDLTFVGLTNLTYSAGVTDFFWFFSRRRGWSD